jgi:hypothetical protein
MSRPAAFMAYLAIWILSLAGVNAAQSCTIKATGGDDGPAFQALVHNASCSTITVPKGTTLSIHTKMNMTGLLNKHIVYYAYRKHASYSYTTLVDSRNGPIHKRHFALGFGQFGDK